MAIIARPINASQITASRIAARGVETGSAAGAAAMPWLFNFNAKMTALPIALRRMNATYTRNSEKCVVQDGALVTLSANQFGTSQDPVTGLYGYVPEPAATNLLSNSGLAGATIPPTNYTQPIADGSSVFTTTTLGTRGISIAVAGGRNFIANTISVSASATYTVSLNVYVSSGSITAENVLSAVSLPVGATVSYPVCSANPSGGASSVIVSGVLVINIVVAATAGVAQIRMGAGALVNSTASLTITTPQAETGLRVTSWILTPTGSTASRAADVLSVPLWVNNLSYSQEFDNASWSKSLTTVSANAVAAPDGTTTADKIVETAVSGIHYVNRTQLSATTNSTISIYAKAGERSRVGLYRTANSGGACFDLNTGLVVRVEGTSPAAATGYDAGTDTTATIVSVGGGWYRCSLTRGATSTQIGAHYIAVDTSYQSSYLGDITKGIYVWGAQIEAGSTATTYRPTTSTLASVANQNIPGFVESGYTLFADFRSDVNTGLTARVVTVSDGATSNRSTFGWTTTASTIGVLTFSGTVAQHNVTLSPYTNTSRLKIGYSVAADSFLSAISGSGQTPDTSGSVPADLRVLYIGANHSGTEPLNGFLFRAGLIPQALTQAQINGLTA